MVTVATPGSSAVTTQNDQNQSGTQPTAQAELPANTEFTGGRADPPPDGSDNKLPLSVEMQKALDEVDQVVNDERTQLATETKTIQPIIETRVPNIPNLQHAIGFVGPDGEPIPISTAADTDRTRGVNYPDQPNTLAEASAAGMDPQTYKASHPEADFTGSTQVGDTSYRFSSAPFGGGTEVQALGIEKDGPLFMNIPGTPSGNVCLTPAGVKAMQSAGLIDGGDPAGYSNGAPFYQLNDKAKEALMPKNKSKDQTQPQTQPSGAGGTGQTGIGTGTQAASSGQPTQTPSPVTGSQTPVGAPITDPATGDVTQEYSDGSKTVTHTDGTKTTTDPTGQVTNS